MENDARPPVAIGHVSLRVTDVPQASAYFVSNLSAAERVAFGQALYADQD